MAKTSDIRVRAVSLYFIPVRTRVPLKFGAETLTEVICARARVLVENRQGRISTGWGETPLSVQWAWPSNLPCHRRTEILKAFCLLLAREWGCTGEYGHPLELGIDFLTGRLPKLLKEFNHIAADPMPWLAALIATSPVDVALHDAFGNLLERPSYETYNSEYLSRDLGDLMEPAEGRLQGKYPDDYLRLPGPNRLPAWHLVGGLDPIARDEITGSEPNDGYPVLLPDWIQRDGLKCLKIKLRGTDESWDYQRLLTVGQVALAHGVEALSADFNCMVQDPEYVVAILGRLQTDCGAIYDRLLYVEQPFPYDLESNQLDVRSVAARKPLLLDESAHGWEQVRLGRDLGWSGVALKTCKTQTGAILSGCWAQAHGMQIMVQDLTNPMLAQIPHVQLARHCYTLLGVETNAMQFYPDASAPEAMVHPGLFRRRGGNLDLTTLTGPGFGYRAGEINRCLPPPELEVESE